MAVLSITFKGDDEVAGAAKHVADDIRDVGRASDEAAPKGSGFFGNMMSAASGFLAADLIGNIAGQFKDVIAGGIEDAQKSKQLMAETALLIKNTGGAAGVSAQEVADLASSLSDAAGASLFGDDMIQGAENVLLKFKELKIPIEDVTQLSVDMAQTLGKDPADAAQILGMALQKPFDASAKLAKQGIILTDAQNATLDAFKASGDAAGAQAFLMEQLQGTYAGAAKAAAENAGGMVQFQARMGEAAETLGTALLPLIDLLGGVLSDTLAPAIETVATWLGDNLPGAIATVTAVFGGVVDFFTQGGDSSSAFSKNIAELTTWLGDNLPPAIAAVSEWFNTQLLPALSKLWAFIQENVIPIIDTLVNVAFAVLKADIQILAALWVGVLWPALKQVWAFIDAYILPILADAVIWLKDNLPPAIAAATDFFNTQLLPALRVIWAFVQDNVIPIIKTLVEVQFAALGAAAKEIATFWTTTLQPAFKTVSDFLRDTATKAVAGFTVVVDGVKTAFNFVSDAVGGVIDVIHTLVDLWESIKPPDWIVGHSPPPLADWFAAVGESVGSVTGRIGEFASIMQGLVNDAMQAFHDLADFGLNMGGSSITDVFGGGSTGGGEGLDLNFPKFAGGVTNFSGGMALVGERGPELVQLPRGSSVMPNGAGGGQTVTIVIDDRGADWLKKFIDIQIDDRLGRAGTASLSRQRAGG